jgi:solute carrier family 24 (sodium/potassium/calcium exchanger), member 6
MPPLPITRRRFQCYANPVFSTALIISILVGVSYFTNNGFLRQTAASNPRILAGRGEPPTCRDVYHVEDRCAFVRNHCEDEQPGIVTYLNVYYCYFNYNRFAGFALLALWLVLLFSTIGIAASDFFSPNLQTIANVLSMPENLAGVTFLAIGNGSPDVFSTVMAMRSNSAAMAVGELIGAASFITAIVAGTIACITEFKVGRHNFIRDLCFFIVAVCCAMGFLIDGHLYPFECIFMIGYYVFYVAVVGLSHWFFARRARKGALADAEAARLRAASGQIGFEPYRDRTEDSAGDVSPMRTPTAAQAPGDGMPRISVDGVVDLDETEDERWRHRAAEIAGNMRVRRPTYGRRNTQTFIRPSLLGALEFKSTIDHFRKEEALGGSLSSRGHGRSHSVHNLPRAPRRYDLQSPHQGGPFGPIISVAGASPTGRERAASHGAYGEPAGLGLSVHTVAEEATQTEESAVGFPFPQLVPEPRVRTPSPAGSLLVPGTASEPPTRQSTGMSAPGARSPAAGSLRVQIPSRRSSTSGRSETLSPFPGYTDSPLPMTPSSEIALPQFEPGPLALEVPSYLLGHEADAEEMLPRYRYWPYSVLPAPEELGSTLFPTLSGWNDKGFIDMVVSTIAVPSVLLLSLTLPVVDCRGDDGCSSAGDEGELEALAARDETEWDRFRRRTRSGTNRSSAASFVGIDGSEALSSMVPGNLHKAVQNASQPAVADFQPDDSWIRWQVLIQIALGPAFAVFIITVVLLELSASMVRRCVSYTAVASLVCVVLVLSLTKAEKRPKHYSLLCFPGFLVSVAWIVAIAGEVVAVLKAMGVILAISEAILGLTIFAAGNSVGDWVSNYTIARLGSPVMALYVHSPTVMLPTNMKPVRGALAGQCSTSCSE